MYGRKGSTVRFERFGGVAGLVFATLVVGVNIVIGSAGKPLGDASLSDITTYYSDHAWVSIATSVVAPLIWMALPLFAIGVLVATRGPQGTINPFAVAGVAGAVMQNAIFSGAVATDAVLAVRADSLATSPEFTQTLWDLQHAAMTLNHVSIALAFMGLALAALTSSLTRRWFGWSGLGGAAVMLISGTRSTVAIEGGGIELAMVGFTLWIAWVVSCSFRLIRRSETRPTADGAALEPASA